MTKHEIIDFVVEHYKTNPRAADEGGRCFYGAKGGIRCAHSICVKDSILKSINWGWNASDVIHNFGDEAHKPQFRGHEIVFWSNIQLLHDEGFNWVPNETGGVDLSDHGEKTVKRLKMRFN